MTISKEQMLYVLNQDIAFYKQLGGVPETLRTLEAIIDYLQSAVVVREDWQIVPKIMTDDMYDVISDSKKVWAELLAAAPDYVEE